MAKKFAFAFVALLLCASPFWSQSTSNPQDFTFQVSAAQAWTDTSLDLQPGDVIKIAVVSSPTSGGGSGCDQAAHAQAADLPLPSAHEGALIARLHAQGAEPLLVEDGTELHIKEASHLYLGINMASTSACAGSFSVSVHKVLTGSSATAATPQSQQSRGQQLKSQLSTAAQIFMSGQFGVGKSETTSNAGPSSANSSGSTSSSGTAPALKVSDAPLDTDLRKSLDSLPRRVNDQFQNLGDMVNFVIVGSQKDVLAALDAASWRIADTSNESAVVNAIRQTYESKDYLTMPMSTLYLFGRKQDFGYEMAEPIAMVASRHHFRIWKAPFTWKGNEVWVGAGTHDIGFAKDKRNGNVTHKIDPVVDGERDNIGSSLQKANKAKTLTYYLPPDPVQDAKNATGDVYHSDGRMLVIFLQ
jgi:hypothetical protein